MLFLGGTYSYSSLEHVCLDLNISSLCTKMMKISRNCMSLASHTLKETIPFMKDTCSKETAFVCQGVAPMNSYLEKFIEEHLLAILEKTRHTSWSKSTIFGAICSKTFKTLSKGVQFVKWPKAMCCPKVLIPRCLLHKGHGWTLAWISCLDYRELNATKILFWWLWIGSKKWPIL